MGRYPRESKVNAWEREGRPRLGEERRKREGCVGVDGRVRHKLKVGVKKI